MRRLLSHLRDGTACGLLHASLLLATLLLVGCSPKVTPTIVPAPTHDTIIAHHHTHDSVWVSESERTQHDTVVITRVTERWRVKHDSIYVGRRDTVPIVQTVEVVREVARVPWYYKWPALAFYALLGAIVGLIAVRVALKTL